MVDSHTTRLIIISLMIASVISVTVMVGIFEWRRKLRGHVSQEVKVSLSTILPNALMYWLMSPVWFSIYQLTSEYAFFELSGFYRWIPVAFVMCDLSYYLEHRTAHWIPLLWKMYHGTHHTGTQYNIPLAFRVNALNFLIAPMFYIPWLLLGLDPLLIVGFQLFVFHYQGWVHTEEIGELKIDCWLNSPANHRLHHSQLHQANFGGCLMIWDKLFGTYLKPEKISIFGIAGFKLSKSYWGIYTGLWKRK